MHASILKTFLTLLLSAVALGGCKVKPVDRDVVSVSIMPQKYFVDEMTGGALEVNVMIPPGASHGTYSPTPRQFQLLSDSKLYISIGYLGYEQAWIHRLKELNPDMPELNLSEKTDLITGVTCDHEDHAGHGHEHEGGVDPHIWMSPAVVLELLPLMKASLVATFPDLKDTIESRYPLLVAKAEAAHQELMETSESLTSRSFLIFHPALTYLARDYGFEQIAIEQDGKEPSPALLARTIEQAKEQKIRVIFIQQEYDVRHAGLVSAETSTKVVQLDPLAYDWTVSMRQITRELKEALQ
jgi:zinc transport system substrate-binding protein